MKGFRERLANTIKTSPYGEDIWTLSTDAGLARKTLYNITRDTKLDVSQTGPGLFGMARVAALLGTSLDYLAGIAPPTQYTRRTPDPVDAILDHARETLAAQTLRPGQHPSADALLRIYAKSGGRLEGFTGVLEYCDQYAPCAPVDAGLKVLKVGAKSLAALTMGSASAELLQTAIDTVPNDELKQAWVSAYSRALDTGPVTTLETLNVQMPNHPVKVTIEFVRTLLPVTDALGDRSVLNFSLRIV